MIQTFSFINISYHIVLIIIYTYLFIWEILLYYYVINIIILFLLLFVDKIIIICNQLQY